MIFFNSSFDIVSIVVPEPKLPETLDPNYFYELLHLMLMLLLTLLISTDSYRYEHVFHQPQADFHYWSKKSVK